MAVSPKAFILDTSAYSAFNHGDERLRSWFDTKHSILVPLIVVTELRAGFAAGSKTTENELLLKRFLDSSSVQTLTISIKTTELFASLFAQLRKSGKPMGSNDLWIAALALEHKLPIVTLDTDFTRVRGIEVISVS